MKRESITARLRRYAVGSAVGVMLAAIAYKSTATNHEHPTSAIVATAAMQQQSSGIVGKELAPAQQPPASSLNLLAEGYGRFYYAAIVPESANDEMPQIALYMKDKQSGRMWQLMVTAAMTNHVGTVLAIEKNGRMGKGSIEIIEEVIPISATQILLSGCPDARNIYTYIYDLTTGEAIHLPSYSGFVEFRGEGDRREIVMATYRYRREGGRYGVLEIYNLRGRKLSEEDTDNEY